MSLAHHHRRPQGALSARISMFVLVAGVWLSGLALLLHP